MGILKVVDPRKRENGSPYMEFQGSNPPSPKSIFKGVGYPDFLAGLTLKGCADFSAKEERAFNDVERRDLPKISTGGS